MPPEAYHHAAFIPWSCDHAGLCYREHPSAHYAAASMHDATWPTATSCSPSPIYPHLPYYKRFAASFLGIPQSSFASFHVPFELFQKHRAMIKQL